MEVNMSDLIARGCLEDHDDHDDWSWVAFFKNERVFEISYHGIKEQEFKHDTNIYIEVSFDQLKDFIVAVFGSIEDFFKEVDEVCS